MNLPAFPKHLEVVEPDVGRRLARAFDRLRGLPVALKLASTRTQAQGLTREWQYLLGLSSRFLPIPVEFSRAGEREAFLTASWLEGLPFDQHVRSAKSEDQVAAVLDALAGLDHLHGSGLCHRDVKSRNILIVETPAGPRARWLDLEHAMRAGVLEAAASYVGGRPMGSDPGNGGFPSQDDVRSFCELLRATLKDADDSQAVGVLRAFACRAESVFYMDEMPHARAAWTILREMLLEAKLPVRTECSPLGVSHWVKRRDVERVWREHLESDAPGGTVLLVHGPAGLGKRSFVAHAAGVLAAEGAHVVNLLGVGAPDWAWLDLESRSDGRRVAVLEDGGRVPDQIRRGFVDAGWQVVLTSDSDDESVLDGWRSAGAATRAWTFPGFGARDWYRWIAASV